MPEIYDELIHTDHPIFAQHDFSKTPQQSAVAPDNKDAPQTSTAALHERDTEREAERQPLVKN